LRYVVDANVPIVANGLDTHAGIELQFAAAAFLSDVMKTGIVLEDNQDGALSEYKAHLSASGKPGVGDYFFFWFMRHRWAQGLVERIAIPDGTTPTDHVPAELTGFDPDDHKWIATYLLGRGDFIVNAVDSDYGEWRAELAKGGVAVLEIGVAFRAA
jgi:hypothetical protein